jgi:hypothetical protein
LWAHWRLPNSGSLAISYRQGTRGKLSGSAPVVRPLAVFTAASTRLMKSLDPSERTPMFATGSLANLALRLSDIRFGSKKRHAQRFAPNFRSG